jgi:hypothetical protein
MEATLTEHDFALAEVRFLTPLIQSGDLLPIARFASQEVLSAPGEYLPLDEREDWELREYILLCAQSLYTQNPEQLPKLLDEIGRLGRKRAEAVAGKRRIGFSEASGAGG